MTLPTADAAATRSATFALLRPRWGALAGVLALFAAGTAVSLVGPRLLGAVIDEVAGGGDRSVIDAAAAGFVAVTVVGALLAWAAEARAAVVGEGALHELRGTLFRRVLGLPQATVERAGTGEVLARVGGDVSALAQSVRRSIPDVALASTEIVLTLLALLLLSPVLAAATLCGVPTGVLAARWYLARSATVYRETRERFAAVTTGLHESYAGATTLLAYRRDHARAAALRERGGEFFTAKMAGARLRNVLRTGVTLSQFIALGVVLAVGAALLQADMLSLGAVAAAAFYVQRLFAPVETLLEELDRLQTARAAMARVAGVGLLEPAAPRQDRTPEAGAAVTLRGVRFAYVPGVEVLRGIDLTVPVGQRLALVGPSGAGKSTIAALLAGVHTPDAGSLAVRGRLVLLTQEAHTFLGTVAENLRLAHPEATDEALRAALARTGALDWAEALPDGLGTRIGSGAHRLPAAAHQQLALTRMILTDPDVVILDEATSAFGATSARTVERALDAALHGRTVIAIAHRLHAAAHADRIAVIEGGRIVELGSPAELLAAGGSYAALWARQTGAPA